MSLLLQLMDDLERDAVASYNPFHEIDSDYDFGPVQIYRRRYRPYSRPSWSKWSRLANERKEGFGKLCGFGKDGFKASMDVSQFKPEELNVKVVKNSVVVEGKHEEREDDHGLISRHFVRRYDLPKDYDPEKITSSLSSDGVLTVSAPKLEAIEDKSKERIIKIQQTSEPALTNGWTESPKESVEANTDKDKEKEKEKKKNGRK